MKIKTIGETKIIMENKNSLHNYFAWPTVARLQNGKIAVTASGYRMSHICPFGKAVISYSEDEGETYTRPAPVIDTCLDDRDSGICTFGEKGVILTSFNNSISQQREWNEKLMICTESQVPYRSAYLDLVPETEEKRFLGATFTFSNDCGTTFGDVYVSPVTSPHGPCVLQDGSLLWVGSDFDIDSVIDCKENQIKAYKINLDGTSEYVGEIENCVFEGVSVASCEPHAICLNDGTVICHIRVGGGAGDEWVYTTYQSESYDNGKTWTKPHRVIGRVGGAPAHLLQLKDGTVISVYSRRKKPCGMMAMISRDNCETWETDFEICIIEPTTDLGYPATVELKDGSLLTVYYANKGADTPAVIMQQKWKIEE